jgi:hypothetical protein
VTQHRTDHCRRDGLVVTASADLSAMGSWACMVLPQPPIGRPGGEPDIGGLPWLAVVVGRFQACALLGDGVGHALRERVVGVQAFDGSSQSGV